MKILILCAILCVALMEMEPEGSSLLSYWYKEDGSRQDTPQVCRGWFTAPPNSDKSSRTSVCQFPFQNSKKWTFYGCTSPKVKKYSQCKNTAGDWMPCPNKCPKAAVVFGGPYILTMDEHRARLYCNTTASPNPELFWKKNSETISTSTVSPPEDLFPTTVESTLQITSTDKGNYRCEASSDYLNTRGWRERKSNPLNIPVLEAYLTVNESLLDSLTLQCQAEGWPKPTAKLQIYERSKKYTTINPTEEFTRIVERDNNKLYQVTKLCKLTREEKSYYCNVKVSTKTKSTYLDVRKNDLAVAADIPRALTALYVHPERDDIKLTCNATGIPAPDVYWKKGVEYLYDGVKTDKHDKYTTSTVTMRHTEENDGTYTCKAKNEKNVKLRTIEISETNPIGPVALHIAWTANTATTASLSCSGTGRPKPQIAWLQENTIVSKNGQLTLFKTPGYTQTYTCEGKNKNDQADKPVTVEGFPREPAVIQSLGPVSEHNHSLMCKGRGIPKPDIVWSKDNKIIKNTESHFELENNILYTISVLKLKKDEMGAFTCNASNSKGKSFKKFTYSEQNKNENESDVVIITVITAAIIVTLLAIFVGVFCYRKQQTKHKKEKLEGKSGNEAYLTTGTSGHQTYGEVGDSDVFFSSGAAPHYPRNQVEDNDMYITSGAVPHMANEQVEDNDTYITSGGAEIQAYGQMEDNDVYITSGGAQTHAFDQVEDNDVYVTSGEI